MSDALKRIAKKVIPYRYHLYFSPVRNVRKTRKDIVVLPIGKNASIEVYWREDTLGMGPASSVYVDDKEILRFDCFGKKDGHFHVTTPYKGNLANERIYYSEKSVEDQIERSYFEIERNLNVYLGMNPFKKVRQCKIDAELLDDALQRMKQLMLAHFERNASRMIEQ